MPSLTNKQLFKSDDNFIDKIGNKGTNQNKEISEINTTS